MAKQTTDHCRSLQLDSQIQYGCDDCYTKVGKLVYFNSLEWIRWLSSSMWTTNHITNNISTRSQRVYLRCRQQRQYLIRDRISLQMLWLSHYYLLNIIVFVLIFYVGSIRFLLILCLYTMSSPRKYTRTAGETCDKGNCDLMNCVNLEWDVVKSYDEMWIMNWRLYSN